jgi:hypothetical protein
VILLGRPILQCNEICHQVSKFLRLENTFGHGPVLFYAWVFGCLVAKVRG